MPPHAPRLALWIRQLEPQISFFDHFCDRLRCGLGYPGGGSGEFDEFFDDAGAASGHDGSTCGHGCVTPQFAADLEECPEDDFSDHEFGGEFLQLGNEFIVGNITTGCFIHPDEDRPLTIREGARVQSFSDDFQFIGGIGAQMRLIGNAVPHHC